MIRIEHLKKRYEDGDNLVLNDVNIEIGDGEIVSIIGPSGSGKSTLLRCINMLEKPTAGRIWIDGVELTDPKTDISKVRRNIGMVFQSFNLFEHLSVIDNVMVGLVKLRGVSPEVAEVRALELLDQVGMLSKANAFPHQLSGGQKQRVAIARCLSMEPKIILFDEPTSALDPTMVSEVLRVIRDIANRGITMIVVTHEMQFARNVSTRVVYLDDGTIYEDGTPEQIFDNPVRERTQFFIKRVRTISRHFDSHNVDLYCLLGEIHNFCFLYGLDGAISQKVENAVQKVLSICLNSLDDERMAKLKSCGGMDLDVAFSEKSGHVRMRLVIPIEMERYFDDETEEGRARLAELDAAFMSVVCEAHEGCLQIQLGVNCR